MNLFTAHTILSYSQKCLSQSYMQRLPVQNLGYCTFKLWGPITWIKLRLGLRKLWSKQRLSLRSELFYVTQVTSRQCLTGLLTGYKRKIKIVWDFGGKLCGKKTSIVRGIVWDCVILWRTKYSISSVLARPDREEILYKWKMRLNVFLWQ